MLAVQVEEEVFCLQRLFTVGSLGLRGVQAMKGDASAAVYVAAVYAASTVLLAEFHTAVASGSQSQLFHTFL